MLWAIIKLLNNLICDITIVIQSGLHFKTEKSIRRTI